MPVKSAPADLATEPEQARLRASRRQAIIKALGKGGAVVAAASPLHSYATRNIVTSTGQQCTVSGNQSAAVSASAGTQQVCGAYRPRHFLAVGAAFSLTDSNGYNQQQLNAYAALSPAGVLLGTEYLHSNGTVVFIKTTTTTMRRLAQPANTWPTAVSPQGQVGSLFPGLGTKTLLAQLYGSLDGATVGTSDGAYFVAAYLNAAIGTAPSGFVAVPFDAAYVQSQYTDNQTNALAFFKLICTVA